MSKQFYDEFSKQTVDKMAQSIEDMTYLYDETKVPKSHYKKHLTKGIEEMIEGSVEINFIDIYYRTMQQLKKESEKRYFQSVLCIDLGVNPSKITPSQYQALEMTWAVFTEDKKKASREDLITYFREVETNGATFILEKDED
ncbi:hypothetical protein CKN63_13435 [Carnobacterium divergens]|uniref:hypothetical protein n=1 Tax=Carnobacterium divergens TaxID=2748 RepID=UPI001072AAFF|nr:hypothetical protein [Carnobacterium divergens]TFI60561.1 hypothetical protein CKN59_13370 [Carnobacterium divergens]TFI61640.1 hypothetical protein CKN76_12615 [Carnobacterium divergens]TFJ01036.1 hypothetical protein CKN75_12960 [Carnobacterium divergens]TFJ08956.1 hypothetical protein CKN71_12975 [Carnobacterium divergens]TFJ15665.1 hypothetical protein CKN63_13435 [Carnobacterium divergens]